MKTPDVGDVVKVKHVEAMLGSTDNKKYLGRIGIIAPNDGWGLCRVNFGEDYNYFWNAADLQYASKKEADAFRRCL